MAAVFGPSTDCVFSVAVIAVESDTAGSEVEDEGSTTILDGGVAKLSRCFLKRSIEETCGRDVS